MSIPEEAYEAATRAEWNHWGPSWHTLTYDTDTEYREYLRSQIERAVEAAAPFIAAQALREEADYLDREDLEYQPGGVSTGLKFGSRHLRSRADELEEA